MEDSHHMYAAVVRCVLVCIIYALAVLADGLYSAAYPDLNMQAVPAWNWRCPGLLSARLCTSIL